MVKLVALKYDPKLSRDIARRISFRANPKQMAMTFGLPVRHFAVNKLQYFTWDLLYADGDDLFDFTTPLRILYYPPCPKSSVAMWFLDTFDDSLTSKFVVSTGKLIQKISTGEEKSVIVIKK